jgi:hypothetical protein
VDLELQQESPGGVPPGIAWDLCQLALQIPSNIYVALNSLGIQLLALFGESFLGNYLEIESFRLQSYS